MGEQWVAYQDELGYRAGRIGRGVEAEVAAMAGEADAERHLARRRRGGDAADEEAVRFPFRRKTNWCFGEFQLYPQKQ